MRLCIPHIWLIGLLFFISCEPWNLEELDFLKATTVEAIEVTAEGSVLRSSVEGDFDDDEVSEYGHIWSKTPLDLKSLDVENSSRSIHRDIEGLNDFVDTLNGLELNTIYHYAAYVVLQGRSFLGEPKQFKTNNISVGADQLLDENVTIARVASSIFGLEGDAVFVTSHGHCWKAQTGGDDRPSISNNDGKTDLKRRETDGVFESLIEGVLPGQSYNIISYARYQDTIIYGDLIEFRISDQWNKVSEFPVFGSSEKVHGFVLQKDNQETLYILFYRSSNNFWSFSAANQSWQAEPDFPGERRTAAANFSIANKGYIATGKNIRGSPLKDTWQFDPDNRSWKQMNDFGGSRRSRTGFFVIDSTAYVMGGLDLIGRSNETWSFDLHTDSMGTWTEVRSMPVKNGDMAAFSIDDFGYVTQGSYTFFDPLDENIKYVPTVWRYDPNSAAGGRWTELEDQDFPGIMRSEGIYFVIGQAAYIGMGLDFNSTLLRDFWRFEPGQGWERVKSFQSEAFTRGRGFSGANHGYFLTNHPLGNDLWFYFSKD